MAVVEKHERKLIAHARLLATREKMLDKLDDLPNELMDPDKAGSNRFLRDILESIEVSPECEYKFSFR